MKKVFLIKIFAGGLFIFLCPIITRANNHHPGFEVPTGYALAAVPVTDTLPPPANTGNDKPADKVIKEVPKSHNQPVPVAVTVQVKPFIIVKPKMIKPVIKVLH